LFGKFSRFLRYVYEKNIFKYCGKNVNIERGASFGTGFDLEIGDKLRFGKILPCALKYKNWKRCHDGS